MFLVYLFVVLPYLLNKMAAVVLSLLMFDISQTECLWDTGLLKCLR